MPHWLTVLDNYLDLPTQPVADFAPSPDQSEDMRFFYTWLKRFDEQFNRIDTEQRLLFALETQRIQHDIVRNILGNLNEFFTAPTHTINVRAGTAVRFAAPEGVVVAPIPPLVGDKPTELAILLIGQHYRYKIDGTNPTLTDGLFCDRSTVLVVNKPINCQNFKMITLEPPVAGFARFPVPQVQATSLY